MEFTNQEGYFSFGFPLLVGCSNEQSEELAAAEAVYNTQLDTQQIMSLVLEPASDILWDSAGWVMDAAGYEDLYPTTDEGWDFVRAQAAIVVESGNMLALPGRAEDNDAWMIYSEGLSEAGLLAMKAAAEQNEEDFFKRAHNFIASARPVIKLTIQILIVDLLTAAHNRYRKGN